MDSTIRETLVHIGAVNPSNLVVFADRTRDAQVRVLKDTQSGVIFIDNFYVGDAEYEAGTYRGAPEIHSAEDLADSQRRLETFAKYVVGRKVLDFGCGQGTFLKSAKPLAESVSGIELDRKCRRNLAAHGINVYEQLSTAVGPFDTIFMFHVLEHLANPLDVLSEIRELTKASGGNLVVEVPHANDFLLSKMELEAFREFTLWSQHLILHTRESLRRLLSAAGFTEILIRGVQRYSLANHFTWLRDGRPGGHLSDLAAIETPELRSAYESSLAALEMTDSLVAVAR